MDLYTLRRLVRMTQAQAAAYCGLSLRTWKRYEKNTPVWALRLFSYRAGYLPDWRGFRIDGLQIWTPTGDCVHLNQIESYYYQLQLHGSIVRDLQNQLRALRAALPPRPSLRPPRPRKPRHSTPAPSRTTRTAPTTNAIRGSASRAISART